MIPRPASPRSWLVTARRFLGHFLRRVREEQCTRVAASLAYTSLLALVPLLTVVFGMLTAFPAFEAWRGTVEQFVFQNFVPALGQQVQGYLVEFASKANTLQAAGVAVLLYTVLALMWTIESAFNRIWRARQQRPMVLRFLVYWAVLTLGPFLIGAGLVATSYVVSLPLLRGSLPLGMVGTQLLNLLPFLATLVAFILFYKLIPHRRVRFVHAAIGGATAALLFEIAKQLFAIYVTRFASQEKIYGAFATLPVFLLWIYLSWLVVVLGAVLTQAIETFDPKAWAERHPWLRTRLYCAFRVLANLHAAQRTGTALSDQTLAEREPALDHQTMTETLAALEEARWIGRDECYCWVLVRDLNGHTLADLVRLTPTAVLPPHDAASDPADARLADLLFQHADWMDRALGMPLPEIFGSGVPPRA